MGEMGAKPVELCVVWTRSPRLLHMRGRCIFQCPRGQCDTRRSNPFHPVLSGRLWITVSDEIRLFRGCLFVSSQITGSLRLASANANAAPQIDLGLFNQESDLDTMVHGVTRLRNLLRETDFGTRRGVEFAPGEDVIGAQLKTYIRNHAGTAYHPVGTLRLGGPVTPQLRVKQTERLWVADASIMPQVTSANTNAPSMMIGWKGAEFIAREVA